MTRARPRGATRAAALAALVLVVVACATSSGPTPGGESPGPTGAPTGSVPIESPAPTDVGPTAEPTAGPASPSPTETGGPNGPAGACSGTVDNRDFFSAAAASVSWDVYCAVLPERWSVVTGSYRGRDGGRLEIAYRGPGGVTLRLDEGAFCPEGTSCTPLGTEIGEAAFGDRSGVIVQTDGGYALAVDAGDPISWLATGSGLDEASFRDLCGQLHLVAE